MVDVTCPVVPANPGKNLLPSDSLRDTSLGGYKENLNPTWEELDALDDPWRHFLMWESEWHAREAIDLLRQMPHVTWGRFRTEARTLSLEQIWPQLAQERKCTLNEDVRFVTAAIRQAKEYYQAGLTISELTRPALLYYSALMLSQAAVVAIYGTGFVIKQKGHGLKVDPKQVGKNFEGSSAEWPTYIEWQKSGDFVTLYRRLRWDQFWQNPMPPKRFHILECLRSVGIIDSSELLRCPSLRHLLWSDNPENTQIFPQTIEHVVNTPCFEMPRLAVLWMILFWLSVMSRYHPVRWQYLLAGHTQESYYFRQALHDVPREFVRSMHETLPHPYDIRNRAIYVPSVDTTHPSVNPDQLQQPYSVTARNSGPVPCGCRATSPDNTD